MRRHRFYLRAFRKFHKPVYVRGELGTVRSVASLMLTERYSYPDAVDCEQTVTHSVRWTPPLVRDRKTRRAMERQALHGSDYFKAGTRAEHKRPIDTVDMISREASMTRTRLHAQRLYGIARLRGIHPRVLRHLDTWRRILPATAHLYHIDRLAMRLSLRGRFTRLTTMP